MQNLDWRGFEEIVFRIQSANFPGAVVSLDAKITDVVTKRTRQVDIAINITSADGLTQFIAVECKKFRARKVCQPHVEQFVSFLKSIAANKGIMVASAGYSSSAKVYAKAMDVDLFTVNEASGLEWQSYLKVVSRPVIKKRITTANVAVHVPKGAFHVRAIDLHKNLSQLHLFRKDKEQVLKMKDYRKRHPEVDFNFFMHMPDLHSFLVEMMEDRVESKLDTSRNSEFENLLATAHAGNRPSSWEGRIAHVFLDHFKDMVRDPAAPLFWMANVHFGQPLGQPLQDLYIGSEQSFVPFLGVSLSYATEVSHARYCGDNELSERDVTNGVAYVDMKDGGKRYFFLSELLTSDSKTGRMPK